VGTLLEEICPRKSKGPNTGSYWIMNVVPVGRHLVRVFLFKFRDRGKKFAIDQVFANVECRNNQQEYSNENKENVLNQLISSIHREPPEGAE
jgi:hypothetical protein